MEKTILTYKYVFTFGKYKGKTVREILDINPSYLQWVHENIPHLELSDYLLDKVDEAVQEEYYNKHDYCSHDIN